MNFNMCMRCSENHTTTEHVLSASAYNLGKEIDYMFIRDRGIINEFLFPKKKRKKI